MTESQARAEIVAYAGLLWARGLVYGTSGNVSVRLADGTLLVTPSGRSLRSLDPDELVRTTPDGRALDPDQRPTSELPLHVAAYRMRRDITCVIHTHPTACVAWSNCGLMFPLETVGAMESLDAIHWTSYAPTGTVELADRCAHAFGAGAESVVMERHGLSSVGPSLERAFVRTDLAEQTAAIELSSALLRIGISADGPTSDRLAGGSG
ncbi:MAG TPA: class II aldolase/adducin family protein [Candidatus Baltobacteraceae bacterium]